MRHQKNSVQQMSSSTAIFNWCESFHEFNLLTFVFVLTSAFSLFVLAFGKIQHVHTGRYHFALIIFFYSFLIFTENCIHKIMAQMIVITDIDIFVIIFNWNRDKIYKLLFLVIHMKNHRFFSYQLYVRCHFSLRKNPSFLHSIFS